MLKGSRDFYYRMVFPHIGMLMVATFVPWATLWFPKLIVG
jgi:hypothetical protein